MRSPARPILVAVVIAALGVVRAQQVPTNPPPVPTNPPPVLDKPNPEIKQAIADGLAYLASKQADDGSWSFGKDDKIEATGLVILAFAGSGHTHRSSPPGAAVSYAKPLDKAVRFLISKMSREGKLDERLIAQATAAWALSELYGKTSDIAVRGPAQRSVNVLVDAQDSKGGLGSKRGEEPNFTTTFWAFRALKSAQMAGTPVSAQAMQRTKKYLDSLAAEEGTQYAEKAGGKPSASATAMALLCRQLLGAAPKDPAMVKSAEYLFKSAVPRDLTDLSTTAWATQALNFRGMVALHGKKCEDWNAAVRALLLKSQEKGGKKAADKGSWAPPKADDATRLRTTALALITLQVYSRPALNPGGLPINPPE